MMQAMLMMKIAVNDYDDDVDYGGDDNDDGLR